MTPAPITTADMRALLRDFAARIRSSVHQWSDNYAESEDGQRELRNADVLEAILARLEQQEPKPRFVPSCTEWGCSVRIGAEGHRPECVFRQSPAVVAPQPETPARDHLRVFLLHLESLNIVGSPEVCIEPDGDIGFDWMCGKVATISAHVRADGRCGWASLINGASTHGTFQLPGWHEAFTEDLKRFAAYELASVPPPAPAVEIAPPENNGLDFEVLRTAYGWIVDGAGEIHGLIAGDQCYAPTGIKLDPRDLEPSTPSVDVEALRALPRWDTCQIPLDAPWTPPTPSLGGWVKWSDLAALWPPQADK